LTCKNHKVVFSYKGTNFHGLVEQPDNEVGNIRTVVGEIKKNFELVAREPISIAVAGRTDKGVHARAQVGSFTLEKEVDIERMKRTCNSRLAPEVIIESIENVDDDFHARFSAKARTYRYFIYNAENPSMMLDDFTWHVHQGLDVKAMQEAAAHFIGEKDFTSVCRSSEDVKHNVRKITRAELIQKTPHELMFQISANAFCWQMVRSIVGLLVSVGKGKISPDEIPAILDKKDREYGSHLAPAKGLTLWEVSY